MEDVLSLIVALIGNWVEIVTRETFLSDSFLNKEVIVTVWHVDYVFVQKDLFLDWLNLVTTL
jgi:hypothetical protein